MVALDAHDALFLDFDGTLVEIAERPDHIQPAPDLPLLLDRLRSELGGAVALVSGRTLAEIDRYLRPFRFAGAGVHGVELRRRPDGATEYARYRDLVGAVGFARRELAAIPGAWLEDKRRAFTLHFRGAPQAEARCRALAHEIVARYGLHAITAKMAFEVVPQGVDKGTAVQALMRSADFAGRRPVFIGDDVTDEDGFAAVQTAGGVGIRIGPGETIARQRLADVGEALTWLARATKAA